MPDGFDLCYIYRQSLFLVSACPECEVSSKALTLSACCVVVFGCVCVFRRLIRSNLVRSCSLPDHSRKSSTINAAKCNNAQPQQPSLRRRKISSVLVWTDSTKWTLHLSVGTIRVSQHRPYRIRTFISFVSADSFSVRERERVSAAKAAFSCAFLLEHKSQLPAQYHGHANYWCTLLTANISFSRWTARLPMALRGNCLKHVATLPFLLLSSTTCHFVATISVYWAANLQINQINRRCDWGDSWLLNQLTSVSWLLMHQLITATQKSEFGLDKPLLGGQHGSLTRVSVRKISQSWSVN